MAPNSEHSVTDVDWIYAAGGWVITCSCGWFSGCCGRLASAGQEFDDHLEEQTQ